MTKDEALKLALEALETLHDENMDYLTRNKLGGENNQCMVFAREAITAIKEALAQPEQDYERGFIDGMQKQMQSSVDKAVNRLAQRTWVGLTEEEIDECYYWKGRQWTTDELVRHVEAKLREKNNG